MIALLLYLCFGLALAWSLLPEQRGVIKCWLGLVFGCAVMMWLPCLAAFTWGFTKTAQDNALGLAAGLALVLAARAAIKARAKHGTPRGQRPKAPALSRADAAGLFLALAATAFCAYLLHTHVLLPGEDGGLYVGQSTYGDLAMHLGFIESLYRQGTFPPEYSIYPGQQLNYPFLVDAASASLRFFGLSLRMSVIAPSVVMLFCVFWGFWHLAKSIARRLAPTVMAWLLFVGNGGFGFVYFCGKYDLNDLMTGYYTTPTNLSAEDIRWVNVVCDMLIPQRTTMAGWCVLLAAMYLLITVLRKCAADGSGLRESAVLAVLGGSLLMIHTHSFLALGILSAVWFFCVLPGAVRAGYVRALLRDYIVYGVICIGLAAPQFFKWTMDSVATGNLLRPNLGWVVGQKGALTNWLVFYCMNVGVVFLAMWPMLPTLRGERLYLFLGAAAIFVLANLVAFQPNLYDNNKLLYVWYMLTDILVCDYLWRILETAKRRALRTALCLIIVLLGVLSGAMSMARETVSRIRLFSAAQAEAADFIVENTAPDSVILTGTEHPNPVTALTGRSVPCGPAIHLYFHGIDYAEREAEVAVLYQGGPGFRERAARLDIDYVYIGRSELNDYDVDLGFFAENYPLAYYAEDGSIAIYYIGGTK